MNITLKPAAAADLPELLELAHQASKAPGSRWSEDYPNLELDDMGWQDGLTAAWELSRLAVFPDYQGTGMGQAIFGAALELCRKEHCPGLRLLVSLGFEQGIHIYEKYGFQRVGETHQWGEDFWMYSLTL